MPPSARISRGFVSLAASAITAVYAVGYLHTQAADSALGDYGLTAPVATEMTTPGASLETPAAAQPIVVATSTATAGVITDQAVEMYADQHHLSWDQARAEMKSAGWIEQQVPVATSTTSTLVRAAPVSDTPVPGATPTTRAGATSGARPTATPLARPTATSVARSAPVAPAPPTVGSTAASFKDGTYAGLGTSRRGNIQVSLAVQAGRIASVTITGSTTEYPTRLIAGLPAQVVSRQSAQVDAVSGATYSMQAFRAAVQQALQSAHA